MLSTSSCFPKTIAIVVLADATKKLCELVRHADVWLIASPANIAAVGCLKTLESTGTITTFAQESDVSRLTQVVEAIRNIGSLHGSALPSNTYNRIEIYGIRSSPTLCHALSLMDFEVMTETRSTVVALRTQPKSYHLIAASTRQTHSLTLIRWLHGDHPRLAVAWAQLAAGGFGVETIVEYHALVTRNKLIAMTALLVVFALSATAGALLLKNKQGGVPLSLLIQGVQMFQWSLPGSSFNRIVLGPYATILWSEAGVRLGVGAVFGIRAPPEYATSLEWVGVNCLAVAAFVYLWKRPWRHV